MIKLIAQFELKIDKNAIQFTQSRKQERVRWWFPSQKRINRLIIKNKIKWNSITHIEQGKDSTPTIPTKPIKIAISSKLNFATNRTISLLSLTAMESMAIMYLKILWRTCLLSSTNTPKLRKYNRLYHLSSMIFRRASLNVDSM